MLCSPSESKAISWHASRADTGGAGNADALPAAHRAWPADSRAIAHTTAGSSRGPQALAG